jgi:intracellular septation protein
MKIFLDLLPIILFFVAFKIFDIYTATAVAIGASIVMLVALKLAGKKIDTMMWVSVVVVVVFGGATLIFHDEKFIKLKPTILFWAMAIALAVAQFLLKKNPLTDVFKDMDLPERVWKQLALSLIIFYALMGVANWILAFELGVSTDTWVNLKLFAYPAVNFVFIIALFVWLQKHLPADSAVAKVSVMPSADTSVNKSKL